LGVDLVPLKTCSYDCIYCQLGTTTCKTVERKEWVPLDDVLAELADRLSSRPDYITLSGSGEPTLYSRLDELIGGIKRLTSVPVAVLSNGSLFWQEEVRAQISQADLVIPSLDAADETMFQAVNRPHASISFERMLEGLVALRRDFPAQYWLEIMVVGGYTSDPIEVEKLAACAGRIQPDRVQLNTVTRPPAEAQAAAVSRQQLHAFCARFDPPAEVIADFRGVHQEAAFAAGRQEVFDMLLRRPCSVEDIAGGLDLHRNEVIKHLEELRAQGEVVTRMVAGKQFYTSVSNR
jgi:wyosine [tRNA(Phe)-imidazoG37] synthetase (radical SAM superfamily)